MLFFRVKLNFYHRENFLKPNCSEILGPNLYISPRVSAIKRPEFFLNRLPGAAISLRSHGERVENDLFFFFRFFPVNGDFLFACPHGILLFIVFSRILDIC